ncbi:hypothetical protein ACFLZV_06210 [Candidatus Margulisiibacteriota bacterium]
MRKGIEKIYNYFMNNNKHYEKKMCHRNIDGFLKICRKNMFFGSNTIPEDRVFVIYSHNDGNGVIHYGKKEFGWHLFLIFNKDNKFYVLDYETNNMINFPLNKPIELKEYLNKIFSNQNIKKVLGAQKTKNNTNKNHPRKPYSSGDVPDYDINPGFKSFPRFLVFSVDEYLKMGPSSFDKLVPSFLYSNLYTRKLISVGRVLIRMSELIQRINFIKKKSLKKIINPNKILSILSGCFKRKLITQKREKLQKEEQNLRSLYTSLNQNSPGWDLFYLSKLLFPNQNISFTEQPTLSVKSTLIVKFWGPKY